MRTQLFIQNYEIELDEGVQFLLNKEFEDLSNPTDIINDWSKTVSIPFTEKNNKIFGYIYNPDRVIVSDGTETSYTRMGIYFDPTKKLDFKLVYDNFILMEGYAKMIDIKIVNYTGTYNITLNGQLGKIFQELKKITFDTTTEDTDYLIHGEDYVEEYIDRNLVYNNWTSPGQTHINLMKKDNIYYNINDILGWAPNNSFSDGFKYDSFLTQPNKSMKFTDALGDEFTEATGVSPDTVLPDGMLPREIGEYRSYLQLPFIYWNKLFQMFQTNAEEITGYTFDLDGAFFTPSNPDWYNLVYMLKPFNAKDGTMTENANYYTANPYSSMNWQAAGGLNNMTFHRTTNLCTYTNGTNVETIPMIDLSVNFTDGKWFTIDDINKSPIFKIRTLWSIWDENGTSSTSTLNTNNALVINVNAVGENGYVETVKFLVRHSGCTITEDGANIIEFDGSTKADTADLFNVDADFLITKMNFGNSVRFRFETYWKNSNWCLTSNGNMVTLDPYTTDNPNFTYITFLNDTHRSYAHFIFNDLWNNDYNIFGEILKYCKKYRIYIYVDEFNKKICFTTYNKYFENYSIIDWTDKLDRSKDMIIKPITLENKYILFNYDDSKTKLGTEYKEKFGVNYGEYKLTTDYNFNSETKKLFDKLTTSITNTDNILSWANLENHKITYSFPNELFVYNKDKDKKQVDVFGEYFYFTSSAQFSTATELNLRPVYISDDTAFQQAINTYCYAQDGGPMINVTTYPKLDIVYNNDLCLFNIPKENYTYLNNYTGKSTIYSKYWRNYISERYNIQNKIVTCYLIITPKDWIDFQFNKFITIDGVLYMVNKIYDFNIENQEPTKVDLITITDISGYTN